MGNSKNFLATRCNEHVTTHGPVRYCNNKASTTFDVCWRRRGVVAENKKLIWNFACKWWQKHGIWWSQKHWVELELNNVVIYSWKKFKGILTEEEKAKKTWRGAIKKWTRVFAWKVEENRFKNSGGGGGLILAWRCRCGFESDLSDQGFQILDYDEVFESVRIEE